MCEGDNGVFFAPIFVTKPVSTGKFTFAAARVIIKSEQRGTTRDVAVKQSNSTTGHCFEVVYMLCVQLCLVALFQGRAIFNVVSADFPHGFLLFCG